MNHTHMKPEYTNRKNYEKLTHIIPGFYVKGPEYY